MGEPFVRQLGPYEVQRELGRGGMGAVYLARDTRLGRQVAIKLLPNAFITDTERVRRFRQEARAISALNHPNILTIHEIGEANTAQGLTQFIATEYVAGRTLRAVIKDGGLSLGEMLDTSIQIAAALAAAHQAGVIHRDVKPENLMLRPDGLVKILDFGLAKLHQSKTDATTITSYSTVHTDPGLVLGTVRYMSPEQACGQKVDERTDIFSLGVVLYELLTGRPAFAGTTTGEVLVSLLEREPPPLQELVPQIPAALQSILNRALAKDPTLRYQKCAELHNDLKALKQELELAAHLKRPDVMTMNAASLNLRVGQPSDGKTNIAEKPTTETTKRSTNQSLRLFSRFLRPNTSWAGMAIGAITFLLAAVLAWQRWGSENFALLGNTKSINAIAVLPFFNVNGDTQMDYLAEGLTESLLQSLSRLPDIRVMSRSAVFTYKGRVVDPRHVGKDLAVQAVVAGKMHRQGDRLIIQAEMTNVTDGTRLWSGRYERLITDLQMIQTEIAREISTTLQSHLRPQDISHLATRPTVNSEAYRLYLQGRYLHARLTRENLSQVLNHYNQAILADPQYALAFSGIAHAYADASSQYLSPAEAMPQAKQASVTALSLDENLPEAHLALGLVKFWGDWDWSGAEREFKRALTLNANYSEANTYYASLLVTQRRFDEAIRQSLRVEELDPVSVRSSAAIASVYYFAGQYDRSIAKCRQMLVLYPKGVGAGAAHRILGHSLLQQGHLTEALAEFRQAVTEDRADNNLSWLAYAQAKLGHSDEARAILNEMTMRAQREQVSPVTLARIYLGLGDYEKVFAALRKAVDARSDHLLRLNIDPLYSPLHKDPRFIALLREIGLKL